MIPLGSMQGREDDYIVSLKKEAEKKELFASEINDDDDRMRTIIVNNEPPPEEEFIEAEVTEISPVLLIKHKM